MSQIDPTILSYHLILFTSLIYCFSYYMFILKENYIFWMNLMNLDTKTWSTENSEELNSTYKKIMSH